MTLSTTQHSRIQRNRKWCAWIEALGISGYPKTHVRTQVEHGIDLHVCCWSNVLMIALQDFNSMLLTPVTVKTPQHNWVPIMYLGPCWLPTFHFTIYYPKVKPISNFARGCRSILFRLAWMFWLSIVLVTIKTKPFQARICYLYTPVVLCQKIHSKTPLANLSLAFHFGGTANRRVLAFKSKPWWDMCLEHCTNLHIKVNSVALYFFCCRGTASCSTMSS